MNSQSKGTLNSLAGLATTELLRNALSGSRGRPDTSWTNPGCRLPGPSASWLSAAGPTHRFDCPLGPEVDSYDSPRLRKGAPSALALLACLWSESQAPSSATADGELRREAQPNSGVPQESGAAPKFAGSGLLSVPQGDDAALLSDRGCWGRGRASGVGDFSSPFGFFQDLSEAPAARDPPANGTT